MQQLSVTGGARIGWANATWPLATLSVADGALTVAALMLGTYTFAPNEVVALEAYQSVPLIGRGVRIVHSRSDYPKNVIFWCLSSPTKLLADIEAAGFRSQAPRTSQPRPDGIPVRWTSVAAVVVFWNVLFLLDGAVPWNAPKPPGPFVFLALGSLCAGSFALQKSPAVQAWLMKPGRPVSEIAPVVSILKLVSVFLLITLALTYLFS
jgi:hypothetical protein